jgi:hypothetical protein
LEISGTVNNFHFNQNEMSTSKKLRTLLVKFENELQPWRVNAFRGAVIEKVGRENILFNHHTGDSSYLYRYPLIQYKSIRNKPAILCLGEGVDEIHKLFSKSDWTVNLQGISFSLPIEKLDLNNITLNVWEKPFRYKVYNWLALNGKNYPVFKSINDPVEKAVFLNKILTANILSFAKGVNWRIEKKVEVLIEEISKDRPVLYKNVELQAFDAVFTTNVYMPEFVGLGKGASHGYGMIKQIRNKNDE